MALRIDPTQLREIPINHDEKTFGIPICRVRQDLKTTWCWAACVSMILVSYRIKAQDRLCVIANDGMQIHQPGPGSASDCCDTANATCRNLLLSNCEITQLWDRHKIPVYYTDQIPAAPSQTLLDFLRHKHPVELGYKATIGHLVVLYGWSGDTTTEEFTFYFHDPAYKSNNSLLAKEIYSNVIEGDLKAFWAILLESEADPHCNPTIITPDPTCEKR